MRAPRYAAHPKCRKCKRQVAAEIPNGVRGTFFCSLRCHREWKETNYGEFLRLTERNETR